MLYLIFVFVSFGYISPRIYGSNVRKAVNFTRVLEKTPGEQQAQELVPET